MKKISKIVLISIFIFMVIGAVVYGILNKNILLVKNTSIIDKNNVEDLNNNKKIDKKNLQDKNKTKIPPQGDHKNDAPKEKDINKDDLKKNNNESLPKKSQNKKYIKENSDSLNSERKYNKSKEDIKKGTEDQVKDKKDKNNKNNINQDPKSNENNSTLSKSDILRKYNDVIDFWYSYVENFEGVKIKDIRNILCYETPKFKEKDEIRQAFKKYFIDSEAKRISDTIAIEENKKLYIVVGNAGNIIRLYEDSVSEFKAIQQRNEIKVSLFCKKKISNISFTLRLHNGNWVFTKCWLL
ncbi:hypothetical protein HAHI6034_03480 [Hathewaya histolytica]|uniref:Uncharacterized protein n=1 Tax=Hathewaya histolytica TaxID=1498 RepID=A0A4U9R537_HATHI|nr:hypothetical protein [Hathewaya histolytica]VTQ85601.1 Uncharacterised protein [Hathewaya histolytica]